MRNRTPQRAALDAIAVDIRRDMSLDMGECENCGVRRAVAIHEIPRAGVRKFVYTLASCTLGLCDPGCHQIVDRWPKVRQLALLLMRRPDDFDLDEYNRWAIGRVHLEDVMNELETLKLERGE